MSERRCDGCYDSFSGPWCDNCDQWPCICVPPASADSPLPAEVNDLIDKAHTPGKQWRDTKGRTWTEEYQTPGLLRLNENVTGLRTWLEEHEGPLVSVDDLNAVLDAAYADDSIFSEANRDPVETPGPVNERGQIERMVPKVVLGQVGEHRDAVEADTQHALDDNTIVFAESLLTTTHAIGQQYPELTAHVIEHAVGRLHGRIARGGYTPTGPVTVRIYVEQMGAP